MADLGLVVYERRSCSKCRGLVELLEARGVPFTRVEYHVEGLTVDEIETLLAKADLPPRAALRLREPLVADLGLGDLTVPDDELVRQMAAHPELLQRPLVVRGNRAVLARPVERVLELLDD